MIIEANCTGCMKEFIKNLIYNIVLENKLIMQTYI